MYLLSIFCKPEQQELVLRTLHELGVDRIGQYDHCWAITTYEGSHRALEGANPVFGGKGEVERYPLLKIEINVERDQVKLTVKALKAVLGWEEPMVNIVKLTNDEFCFDSLVTMSRVGHFVPYFQVFFANSARVNRGCWVIT